jgi:hypothetical protein
VVTYQVLPIAILLRFCKIAYATPEKTNVESRLGRFLSSSQLPMKFDLEAGRESRPNASLMQHHANLAMWHLKKM